MGIVLSRASSSRLSVLASDQSDSSVVLKNPCRSRLASSRARSASKWKPALCLPECKTPSTRIRLRGRSFHPLRNRRFTIAPRFNSRNVPETPSNTGNCAVLRTSSRLRIGPRRKRCARHALVRQRAGGARDHALPARNARGIAHRRVQIERDSRRIALAHAPKHKIVLDFVASANAAVAQNAGVVIDGNRQRRIISPRETVRLANRGCANARCPRQRFQFAIAGILLPRAWRRMIRHQKFQQRLPRSQYFLRIRRPPSCPVRQAARTTPPSTRAPVSTTQSRHTPTGVSFCK